MVGRGVHLLLAFALAFQCGPVCLCTLERLLSRVATGGAITTEVADFCVDAHAGLDGDHDGPSHRHLAWHCGGPLGLARAGRPTQPTPSFQVVIFYPVAGLRPTVAVPVADGSVRDHPVEKPPDVGDRLPLLA